MNLDNQQAKQVSDSILRTAVEGLWPPPWLADMNLRRMIALDTALDIYQYFSPTGFSDYIKIPPGNAGSLLSALKFLCDELIHRNHGAKEVLPSATWLSSDRRGEVTEKPENWLVLCGSHDVLLFTDLVVMLLWISYSSLLCCVLVICFRLHFMCAASHK